MSIHKITAIFAKQIKDTLKNKTILIQFLMFPILVVVMENTISMEDMPEHFFVKLFATMYIGMVPLTSMASILSEEKEKNTLKDLLWSNVSAVEYLISVGSYIWIICMLGAVVFGITGGYKGSMMFQFLGIMGVGILLSLIIGAVIGVISKNQMAATSITVPIMLIFSFFPMIAMFNEKIRTVSRFLYSQQIYNLMDQLGKNKITLENVIIIGVNLLLVFLIFGWQYKKTRLEVSS